MMTHKVKICMMSAFCYGLLLLGGCIRDNREQGGAPETNPTDKSSGEMRFGVSSLQSRSGVVKEAAEIKTIGVFGYSTGVDDYNPANADHTPNLLWNRKITRSGSEWTYAPVVYWPTDPTVKNSFFAYSPHSSDFMADNYVIVSAQGDPGNPTLQYSIPPDNMENMIDILYATPRLNKNRYSTDGVNDGLVAYDMKHAMSGIAFLVTAVEAPDGDHIFHLNWLAFLADRMPLTATLDLGYVPTSSDTYGDGAWGAPQAYGSVYYEFDLKYDSESEHESVDVEAGIVIDPTHDKNVLLFLPKHIDKTARATVDLTFIYEDVEYYYYVDMPPVYMHSGLVTVFLVTLSLDGITLEFKEHNLIEEWINDNSGGSEEVEMF